MISPPNNKTSVSLHPVNLLWHKVSNAVSYHVQVSLDSNFITTLLNQTALIDTTTLFSNLSYNTTFYWRVHGTDTSNNYSPWSDVWHFTTGVCDTQRIILTLMWNMISSYINPTDTNFANILSQLGDNLLIVKDGLGQVYWPSWGVDDIQSWIVNNGYQLFVNNSDTLEMIGTLIDPV